MASSLASPGLMRSAWIDSSLTEASSGFQCALPSLAFLTLSCLCFSNSAAFGSAGRMLGTGRFTAEETGRGIWCGDVKEGKAG